MRMQEVSHSGPLSGIRVLDLGHALAAPFAGTMLADFGADVIKVERPHVGDSMRNLGPKKDGVPIWWKAAARGKRSLSLDFSTEVGRSILLKLVRSSDVVIENFRPGTLEKYRLGWEHLSATNPQLVMLRISGFGQTGPRASAPGFGRLADAMSGAANLTGYPDSAPLHVGFSLADTLTGVLGAYGVLVALRARDISGEGDVIDLALYESLFRLIDWQVPVYDQLRINATRAGNRFPDVLSGVMADTVQTADGTWLTYSAATDAVVERLIKLIFGPEAIDRDGFRTAADRAERRGEVEDATRDWMSVRSTIDVMRDFHAAGIPIMEVYDVARIVGDPHYLAREMIVQLEDPDFGALRMHGVVPKLVRNPGRVATSGPDLGAHTEEVLAELLGFTEAEILEARSQGAV